MILIFKFEDNSCAKSKIQNVNQDVDFPMEQFIW